MTVVTIAARATGLTKTYGQGTAKVVALDAVDFEVVQGEFTAIMGPSGSGKSTLMHLLAALDTPTGGTVHIGDTDVASLKDTPLTELRRDRIGFIFQAFNLVPTLTARENIVLPLAIAGRKVDQDWFDRIVDVLGLADRLTHKPSELSGGQQQRVACARALMNRPDIVFGDEPTGNLDSTSASEVLSFLRRSVDEFGQTVVMVTHDAHAASYADRAVFLSDGRIVDEMRGASQEDLLLAMSRIYPRHDAQASNVQEPPEAPTATAQPGETATTAASEAGETGGDVDEQPEPRGRFAAELYREGGPDPESDPDLEEPTIEQSMPRRALMD
ncbi:ABC transporter ATP-binding protein [Tessaracoccus rhinocerotis]|uniref:ABC transporter ATP-binding protein n=1 Tax=Tessaracoccus rhinocerotis TaxID=1689449 RepID=A0A553JWY6_9ACTN|nr:ABC transporter ATP-binding protein [Tessaracoccus rhinocerotis]